MDVRVQARSAIDKCCASGNDVDVPLLHQLLRPRRFQFREIARGFATLWTAAKAQPSRVDAHAADADRFANLIALFGFWSGDNIAFNLRVQRVTDGEDAAPSASQGNPFVQRKDLLKQLSGLPIGQMGGPLGLKILQLRSDALGNSLAERAHGAPRFPLLRTAATRPQPRTRYLDLTKHSPHHDGSAVLVRQHRATAATCQLVRHPACALVRHQHRLNLGEQGTAFGKCESQAGNAPILPFHHGNDRCCLSRRRTCLVTLQAGFNN